MINNGPLKKVTRTLTTPVKSKPIEKSNGNGAPPNPPTITMQSTLSLTPRFTNEEKKILYNLFRQHEDVIDIKNRKKRKGKYSIRDAWQAIVDGFNAHPNVTVNRNFKQIQKFWLNARLRKQYPSKSTKETKPRQTVARPGLSSVKSTGASIRQPIKCEPEYTIEESVDSPDTTENVVDVFQEIELVQPASVSHNDQSNIEPIEDQHENAQLQEQQEQNTTSQTQHQINFDNISTEKLSLNDLLQFKNARPHEDIIFEIKHSDGRPFAIPSTNRITIPQQQLAFNQIELNSEIKMKPQIKAQVYQTPTATQKIQSKFQQQFDNFTTLNLPTTTTQSTIGKVISSENASKLVIANNFEEKINFFKTKETELRQVEVKLQTEEKRLEIAQLEEDLRHLREMHRLQVEELKIKIRILCEEEKQIRIKEN